MTPSSQPMRILVLLFCALPAACGDGGGGGGEPTPNIVIAKVAGDEQEAIVGRTLNQPVQVLVTENNGPVAGATVSWSPTGGTLTPASGTTDAEGLASSAWTLGTGQGLQSVTASVDGATDASVSFTATAIHDAPAILEKVVGDNQRGVVNTLLRGHIQAQVSDQFGNTVPGIPVSWSASGGATVTAATQVTNPVGISSIQVTLGETPGQIEIIATADGLSGSPLTFMATAEAIPTEAEVRVGNNLFASDRNSSTNPAVDTVAVGGSVTWTWVLTGSTPHSVRSLGSPGFASSTIKTGNGATHTASFSAAGSYNYDCEVHGSQMIGRVIVR